ncbi:MAG: Tim44-like domain-containing protein [Betaproteobacteria bacterium]
MIPVLAVLIALLAATGAVEAARMGGGRSLGIQRQSIAPPAARAPAAVTPAPGAATQPVMPAQPGALAPRAAAPAAIPATAAPRTGMSRFLGPIAGIAAGLGIAALLSHFGLPEGFGSFLLLALLAIAVVFVVRAFLARRSQTAMQYAGGPAATPRAPAATRSESAWGGPDRVEPALRSNGVAAAAAGRALPPGFDREAFLRQARMQFTQLQRAWDNGDRAALADVMTPAMFDEVNRDLVARNTHTPTEVVRLDAEVLEVVTEGKEHWASVQFTGLLREDGAATPKPFDETWNLSKPVDDSSGWLLAGIQQNDLATAG